MNNVSPHFLEARSKNSYEKYRDKGKDPAPWSTRFQEEKSVSNINFLQAVCCTEHGSSLLSLLDDVFLLLPYRLIEMVVKGLDSLQVQVSSMPEFVSLGQRWYRKLGMLWSFRVLYESQRGRPKQNDQRHGLLQGTWEGRYCVRKQSWQLVRTPIT